SGYPIWHGCGTAYVGFLFHCYSRPCYRNPTMFRISGNDDFLVDVETDEEIAPEIRAAGPGRYHVDEMSATRLSSGHTARRWGVGIKNADGSVVIEPDPWEA